MSWMETLLSMVRDGRIEESVAWELLSGEGHSASTDTEKTIAVIGMAARLPGAESVDEFWNLLRSGRSALTSSVPHRWSGPSEPPHAGFIQGAFDFDPSFFELRPEQAVELDPQQRLMLDVAWEAFERAGYGSPAQRRSTGVFVAARMGNYGYDAFRRRDGKLGESALWSRSQNFIAAWVADRLDLSGPALVVDSACSSSVTALWLACRALQAGDAAMALVGGVELLLDPLTFRLLRETGALSPDGRCWTFDQRANGYVPGEGAVGLLLKPLSAALRDGDLIHGRILHIAVNNDGRTMGVTTPSLDAQIGLLSQVYKSIDAATIQYVEAHGTGTAIGDPIEFKALCEVFRRPRTGRVGLGSVKTNIGHLHSAAGLASVLKVLMSFREGLIPPTLNCSSPNPRLRFSESVFNVQADGRPWSGDLPRRAAVSSFGFGGTNGHLVLEAVDGPAVAEQLGVDLLTLSADHPATLRMLAAQVLDVLSATPPEKMKAVCATSRLGRAHRRCRIALIGDSMAALKTGLRRFLLEGDSAPAEQILLTHPDDPKKTVLWSGSLSAALAGSGGALEAALFDLETGAPRTVPSALGQVLLGLGVPADRLHQSIRGDGPASDEGFARVPGFDLVAGLHQAGGSQEQALTVLYSAIGEVYRSGADIAWTSFQRGRPWHRVELPPTEQERRTLTLDGRTNQLRAEHLSQFGSAQKWVAHLEALDVLLCQHSVLGEHVLPGIALLSLLHQAYGKEAVAPWEVTGLLFSAPVRSRPQPLTITGTLDSDGSFLIEAEGTRCASGRVKTIPSQHLTSIPLAPLLEKVSQIRSGAWLYARLRLMGYYHGPLYRNISWVAALSDGRVLARIEGERQVRLGWTDLMLPPALLDSITTAALGPESPVLQNEGWPFVPLSIRGVRIHGALSHAAFVVSTVRARTEEVWRHDQVVLDGQGHVLLELSDIVAKRIPAGGLAAFPASPASAPTHSTAPSTAGARTVSAAPQDLLGSTIHWVMDRAGLSPKHETEQFLAAGLDSAALIALCTRLETEASIELYPTILFEYPTPRVFAEYLVREYSSNLMNFFGQEPSAALRGQAPASAVPAIHIRSGTQDRSGYAITGMAVRLPNVSSIDRFWKFLREGEDAVGSAPPERRSIGLSANERGGFLADVASFDHLLFGVSPREAPDIDPQARLFYEVAWEAMSYAGCLVRGSSTGVWVGYSHDHYYEERIRSGRMEGRGLGLQAAVPNRLSYWMDFSGPSLVVNTLCSSSLVALHLAISSLRNGECDVALVGGVQAAISPEYYHSMRCIGALSGAGKCFSFDSRADGYVPGEGAGAIVLKRREDAERDGDQILAVVLGSAMNHGGRVSRLSAPNPRAQSRLMEAAWRTAGVTPETISYVEAHGTGTVLGDAIELQGLQSAMGGLTKRRGFCGIGALKSQTGHLEAAAGILGVIKVVLSAMHRELTPSLHIRNPNPGFDFADSPFYLLDRVRPWRSDSSPRRAGVSSFGMLGVNAHVVLEEGPARELPTLPPAPAWLLRLSAHTSEAFSLYAIQVADFLQSLAPQHLPHALFTLNTGRPELGLKAVVVGESAAQLVRKLRERASTPAPEATARKRVALLFSGQGVQRPGMGRALAQHCEVFREALHQCEQRLLRLGLPSLKGLEGPEVHQTRFAQPALFSLHYALYSTLQHWGIEAALVGGHSLGELSAACAAGVMDWMDGLQLAVQRGELMQQQRAGGIMAPLAREEGEVLSVLGRYPKVSLAAVNGPRSCVVAGAREPVERVCAELGQPCRPLRTSHAFHSEDMEGAVEGFARAVERVTRRRPQVPLLSNRTGGWHTEESAQQAQGWGKQLRETVRFGDNLKRAWEKGARLYWEVGPQAVLAGMGAQVVPEAVWCIGMDGRENELEGMLAAVAQHSEQGGAEPRWSRLQESSLHRRIPVPSVPFLRQRWWHEAAGASVPKASGHPLLGTRSEHKET